MLIFSESLNGCTNVIRLSALIRHGKHSPSATPTHLKPPTAIKPEKPGLATHSSDIAAAAMGNSSGVPAAHLVGGASELNRRSLERKRAISGTDKQAQIPDTTS